MRLRSLGLAFAPPGLALLVLLAGCAERSITSSTQDLSLTPGPPPPAAAAAAPPPIEAPAPKPTEGWVQQLTEGQASKPTEGWVQQPTQEVRVTEPALPPVEPPPPPPPPPAAPPAPVEQAKESPPAAPPVPVSPLTNLADVFFDYDRATIRDDAKAALEANARLLKAEQGWKLLVEGHCDERGTLEYNLVLGERRAQAVQEFLADLGVSASHIQVMSYGKERPVCAEHNQDCWQKNRRAHFLVQ